MSGRTKKAKGRFSVEGVECQHCGTMLHMGSDKMPPVPIEVSFGTEIDPARFPTDYMDSPNAEVHTFDRCRWQQALNKMHVLETRLLAANLDPNVSKKDLENKENEENLVPPAPHVSGPSVPWEDIRDSPSANAVTMTALRALVIEIAHHFDPMFGCIDLKRLDDREWMSKAAAAVGRDVVYPWEKADLKTIDQENKKANSKRDKRGRR